MNAPTAATLEIFKAGTHVAADGRKLTFTEVDLQAIADGYDPSLAEAPLVVGHPEMNAPAYGWARSLRVHDGKLYAEPHQVEPQFAEMVNSGRFKKISASIYLADSPGNPTPGKPYLRHIGLLGAAAPAVKGLRSAQFADGAASVEFSQPLTNLGSVLTDLFQRIRDRYIDKEGLQAADLIIPQWQIRSIGELTADRDERNAQDIAAYAAAPNHKTTEIEMSDPQKTADFAAREQALADQKADIEKRAKALADREAKALRDDAVAFCEGLVSEGKLLPRQKSGAVELLLALPAGTALNFAEGDQSVSKPASEVLRDLLGSMAKQVDFGEKSANDGGDIGLANFSAPQGATVDAGGQELFGKAKAYQASHPNVSWADAVAAVGG